MFNHSCLLGQILLGHDAKPFIICCWVQFASIVLRVLAFSVVMYGCESWVTKKAEHESTDAFEL